MIPFFITLWVFPFELELCVLLKKAKLFILAHPSDLVVSQLCSRYSFVFVLFC